MSRGHIGWPNTSVEPTATSRGFRHEVSGDSTSPVSISHFSQVAVAHFYPLGRANAVWIFILVSYSPITHSALVP